MLEGSADDHQHTINGPLCQQYVAQVSKSGVLPQKWRRPSEGCSGQRQQY